MKQELSRFRRHVDVRLGGDDFVNPLQKPLIEFRGGPDFVQRQALADCLRNDPQPIRRLKAKATDKDTQLVVEVEGEAIAKLLENSSQLLSGAEAKDWLPN